VIALKRSLTVAKVPLKRHLAWCCMQLKKTYNNV